MLRRILNIALNPFFQALIIAAFLILFVPLGFEKYTAEQVNMATNFYKIQTEFADLDHNGSSERIQTFYNIPGNAAVSVHTTNATIGQWNFPGIFPPEGNRIMMGDYDDNERDEVYIFTLVSDSIMLHGLEYAAKPSFIFRDRFIARIGKNLKASDPVCLKGDISDMNGDGTKDLVFVITTGFSMHPRNVFIYDVKNDSLKISPESGVYIRNISLHDINEGGYKEILLSTFAAANFNEDPIPFSDTSAWLMVLDHNLNFLFPPVEFPGPTGSIYLLGLDDSEGNPMIIGNYTNASPDMRPGRLFMIDSNGRFLKEKTIGTDDELFKLNLTRVRTKKSGLELIGTADYEGIFKIDESLDITKISDVRYSRRDLTILDIDQDGTDECILLSPDQQQHIIYRSDFTSPVAIDFPIQSTLPIFSVILNGDDPPHIYVQGDQLSKQFTYGINPVYRFRYLIYAGIYLSVLGFILLIRLLYSVQIKKRYEAEQKLTRLQLAGIKAQIEPHFIMNTINTIGSSINQHKAAEASSQLLNFSNMVRSLLMSSDKLTRTIQEEIDFVRNYLELEKSRFEERLEFSIHVAEDVSMEAVIPKMIIQIHVENALKHGLLPKEEGGSLNISVTKDLEDILITITDDGIGRQQAAINVSQSTGRGMRILAQLFETYNKHNSRPLRQEITDLFDNDNNPCGTEVKIFVPLEFNENIY